MLSLDMIPRRIFTYHRTYLGKNKSTKQINRKCIKKLWQKLVEVELCPWISRDIDNKLKNMSCRSYRKEVVLRMAMYYMVIKRMFVLKCIRAREKHNAKL